MPILTRRRFIASLAAAPAVVTARARPKRFPIAFSTLGCPSWEWKTILEQAARLGYAGVELRGLQGEMDLTRRPEFAAGRMKQTLSDLKALDLRVVGLGSSARMHEPEGATRSSQMDEARRFVDLAHGLSAPYVRVFGDKYVEGEPKQATIARIVAGLRELGQHARGSGVTVLIESHGDFTDSASLLEILKGAGSPAVGLLWDAHHTVVMGRERPEETFARLGAFVRHTHLKDSVPAEKGVRYVLTGEGAVPVRETVKVLASAGYGGYYCFEWEKVWHPEIETPEVAFPHFAKTVARYFAEAGVKADR
jgi:sugar phosphate isomerase/epimerase